MRFIEPRKAAGESGFPGAVDAVRIFYDDGAWLEVPTRVIAEPAPTLFRVWAVRATRPSADASRTAENGGVIARAAVEPVD